MIIIESIEIKYFRSFSDKKVSIENIRDFNIFSGSNDSGKSNVLRALNLFFNNETGSGVYFDVNKDLSKIHWTKSNARVIEKRKVGKKEVRQKDLYVDIKIYFSLSEKHGGMLPKKFFVSRRWTKAKYNPPYQNSNIETRYSIEKGKLTSSQKNALNGQLTQFLHKIEFRYVPAVKDKFFFKHLYKELQGRLLEREISKIKGKSDELQDVIKEETKELFAEFKKSTGLDASFLLLEESTIDFSKSVEVETIGNIFLTNRGDGIQARFIPDVLNEISKDSRKKFIIWGFEEPENSYELKYIKKLRNNFIDIYSIDKQIFITTHSRDFLSVNDMNKRVSIFRVYKKLDDSSQVAYYDDKNGFNKKEIQLNFWNSNKETKSGKNVLDELFSDLGIIEESRNIIELEELVRVRKTNSELSKIIISLKKPIIFVEDEKINLYKVIWLKLQRIIFNCNNMNSIFDVRSPFAVCPAGGKNEVRKKLDMPMVEEYANRKIIGIFDFDDAYNNFNGLSSQRWSVLLGKKEDCLYKYRIDYPNIYAIMIPVPNIRESYVTLNGNNNHLIIEHLFNDKTLIQIKHFNSQKDIGGGGKIVNIKNKTNLWQSAIKLNEDAFSNFGPLFDRINKIIN